MKPVLRSVVVSFLTVALISFGAGVSCRRGSNPTSLATSEMKSAPGFQLESLDGKKVALSDFQGKSVLVHFWASWCPPCLPELPQILSFASKVEKKGWIILAISTDTEWSKAKAALPSGNVLPTNFRVLLDANSRVAEAYGSFMYPESYWVGPEGQIRAKWVGPQEWDELVEKLQ